MFAAWEKRATRSDLWYARVLALAGLFFAIYLPLAWGPPSMQELVPVQGTLVSYSLYRFPSRSRNGDVVALMKLAGHPARFWNDAVKNGSLNRLPGMQGHTIRMMYAPRGQTRPIGGNAVKSWGLWIDGAEIESPEDGLRTDRFFAYVFFPLVGLSLTVFGCIRARYIGNELRRVGTTPDIPFPPIPP